MTHGSGVFKQRRSEKYAELMPRDLERRLRAGENVFVLDVREPHEYRHSRIARSSLIPLGQLAFRLDELPRDRPIVAVCRSGNRSDVAADLLKRAGFEDVANLKGGIVLWQRHGLPVERGQ